MSAAPARIQLRRTKGWRMPPNTVKVDRSTRWGNPFWVEKSAGSRWDPLRSVWHDMWELRHSDWLKGPVYSNKAEATAWAVTRFACEVVPLLDLEDLRGKNLACWCKPGDQCHADVLLEMANGSPLGGEAGR